MVNNFFYSKLKSPQNHHLWQNSRNRFLPISLSKYKDTLKRPHAMLTSLRQMSDTSWTKFLQFLEWIHRH